MTDAHCHVAVGGATRRFVCPLVAPVHFGEMHPREPAPCGRISAKCAGSPRGRISAKCADSPRGRISPKCASDIFFWGVHPWYLDGPLTVGTVRAELLADPTAGVGEIGLDRLHDRTISDRMRETFVAQLELAVELRRPVVLHGAKCWGQVVETIRRVYRAHHLSPSPSSSTSTPPSPTPPPPPTFSTFSPPLLFHGFSRSDGLLPDIVALNGFISVGPAVLNDHAVNYRALVKKIPADRLLVETDATEETAADCPPIEAIAAEVARLRGVTQEELEVSLEANAERFADIRDACSCVRRACRVPASVAGADRVLCPENSHNR